MKSAGKLLCWLAILLSNLASPVAPAASGDAQVGATSIRIELNDGLLSAEFHDAPLTQVLAEIGKAAGFRLVRIGDLNDYPRISGAFEKQPLLGAVEQLVANTSRIFFYSSGTDAKSQHRLSQLWLLEPGEADADTAQPDEVDGGLLHEAPIVRRQAVLRLVQQEGEEAVLEKLSLLLQREPDPLLRSRLATALGALGDERAVSVLESALQDEDSSVRAQSMTALGRIGGDRATMALGNILLDAGVDPLERVIAAQELWKLDSEIARGYLQAGRSDVDDQVREASSKAAAVTVVPTGGSEAGSAATE